MLGTHPRFCRRRCGFTLVELLVVIGIIALLISFLLPSLEGARQASQRVACESKLRQMMVGAQMHLIDHKGYFPMVGVLPGIQPQDLDDQYSIKYVYFSYEMSGLQRMIVPVTIALATDLSSRQTRDVLSNINVGEAETDSLGFIRNFLCPSQASSISEFTQLPMLWIARYQVPGPPAYSGYGWYTQAQSYMYNEAALGWSGAKGQYNSIHQPGKTMFAADGLMGSVSRSTFPYPTGIGMSTLYNITSVPPITMADALTGAGGRAGDAENFDKHRHLGKINIAFCDDHVETHEITRRDLANVYLMAP